MNMTGGEFTGPDATRAGSTGNTAYTLGAVLLAILVVAACLICG